MLLYTHGFKQRLGLDDGGWDRLGSVPSGHKEAKKGLKLAVMEISDLKDHLMAMERMHWKELTLETHSMK